MAFFDFKCTECGFKDEYNTGFSVPKSMAPPETCPKCGKGKMEKLYTPNTNGGFDILGYCYMNEYGKHAWKKRMSATDQANVLMGTKDPY